jgi:UDP-N-acetylmuramoylalanine--D-glutamate ligase
VVISPGVRVDAPGLERARTRGVPVIGEMELACAEISRPIVAITGTNGKTTATTLVGHLMSASGLKNCVGGNIGTPLTSLIGEANEADWVVLEVSSFQLETSPRLKPRIAIWLNATPDHLDRHPSFEAYVELKARLFAPLTPDDWGIYNVSDEVVRGAVLSSRGKLVPFDPTTTIKNGGWYEDGDLWVEISGFGRQRFALENVALEGRHNRENMLAAIIAVLIAGGSPEAIQRGLESFHGLPHRLEFVRELKGVRFFDDSKGTNIGATVRALDSFAEPVILIAGGQDKAGEFEKLEPLIRRGVKQLILIGEARERIRAAVGRATQTIEATTMEDAVARAWRVAEPGDVVLLSPACASFDMFKNYAQRGDVFKDAVKALT